jgi:hypothetical protein
MNGNAIPVRRSPLAVLAFGPLTVGGLAVFLSGLAVAPRPLWGGLLVASCFLLGVALGAAVLLAACWLTAARWSVPLQPLMTRLIPLLVPGAVGVLTVLVVCPSLYPWADTWAAHATTGSNFQAVWLDRPFFLARAVLYVVLWLAFAGLLVRASHRQEAHPPRSRPAPPSGLAAGFLVVFVPTCWLAATDWIMALEPHWSSTVFGVYQFAGWFLSALAALVVVVVLFERGQTPYGRVTPAHLRDLGTLLFAFSSFWMYIWFSQYLLIWYPDNPEETTYYVLRQKDAWQPLFLATPVLCWAVPFLVLLFRPAKENPWLLLAAAVSVLAGHWLDLYVMVLPPLLPSGPDFAPGDAGLVLAAVGLAGLLLVWPFGVRRG